MQVTWSIESTRWLGKRTVQELRATMASARFANRQADEVSLRIEIDVEVNAVFAFGDRVKIWRNDLLYFQGRVGPVQSVADSGDEYHEVSIVGPWSELADQEQVVNFSPGKARDLANIYRPNRDGAVKTTGDFLNDLLTEAATAGCVFQVGSIPPGMEGYSFITYGTYAAAVNEVLKLHPDWVTRWDYSVVPPALYFGGRMERPVVTLPFKDRPRVGVSISRRTDLIPRSVIILTLGSARDGDEGALNGDGNLLVTDEIIIDENSPNPSITLNFLPKNQVKSTPGKVEFEYLTQRIKTRPIPQAAGDPNCKTWWIEHIGFLHALKDHLDPAKIMVAAADAACDLGHGRKETIRGHKTTLVASAVADPPGANPNAAPAPAKPNSAAGFPRELVEGQVEEWMYGIHTGQVEVTASVGYEAAVIAAIGNEQLREAFMRAFPRLAKFGGTWYYFNTFSQMVSGTNAVTKLYRVASSVTTTPAVTAPDYAGQMAFLRNAALAWAEGLRSPPFAGSLTIVETDASAEQWVGKSLCLSGGQAEWATMKAPIQTAEIDFATGQTSIHFGMAEHLGFPYSLTEQGQDLPEPTTTRFDYSDPQRGKAAVPGAYATAKTDGAAEGMPHFFTGGSTLSVVNAKWKKGMLEVYFCGEMAEIHYQSNEVKSHAILGPDGPLDGEKPVLLPAGERSQCWLVWTTDMLGQITGKPKLVTANPDGEFQHFRPPSPEPEEGDPRAGRYRLKVYEVEVKEVGSLPKFYPMAPVPVWQRDAWEGKNIGDGAPLYKQYHHPGRYHFRTLAPTDPLPKDGVDVAVVVEKDAETLTVKARLARSAMPGYGATGSLSFMPCSGTKPSYVLHWENGAILNQGDATIKIPSCASASDAPGP